MRHYCGIVALIFCFVLPPTLWAQGDDYTLQKVQNAEAVTLRHGLTPLTPAQIYEAAKRTLSPAAQAELTELEIKFYKVSGYNYPLIMQSTRFAMCARVDESFAAASEIYRPLLDKWLRAIERQKDNTLAEAVVVLRQTEHLPKEIMKAHFEVLLDNRYKGDMTMVPKMVAFLHFNKGQNAHEGCSRFGKILEKGLSQNLQVTIDRKKDGKFNVNVQFERQ